MWFQIPNSEVGFSGKLFMVVVAGSCDLLLVVQKDCVSEVQLIGVYDLHCVAIFIGNQITAGIPVLLDSGGIRRQQVVQWCTWSYVYDGLREALKPHIHSEFTQVMQPSGCVSPVSGDMGLGK